MELIEYLLNDDNEMALTQSISTIFDEICQYKRKEEKNEKNKEKEDENNDLLSKAAKVEASLRFHDQFRYYFGDLVENPNVKANFKTFLTFILIEIGVFWSLNQRVQDIEVSMVYSPQGTFS